MKRLLSEEEIRYIQELREDSEQAFNRLYQLYCRQVYAFALQYVKIKEDAEDVVQETFVNVWKYRKTIRKEESFVSFLFQITKNLLINKMARTINSSSYEEYIAFRAEPTASRWESAHHQLEYEEFRNILSSLIRQLPKGQQEILRCRLLQELDTHETAQRLNLSIQTVRNQFSNGLKVIREKLRLIENIERFAWMLFLFDLL